MGRGNDENVRPAECPNSSPSDKDRARFGFKHTGHKAREPRSAEKALSAVKRSSLLGTDTQTLQLSGGQEARRSSANVSTVSCMSDFPSGLSEGLERLRQPALSGSRSGLVGEPGSARESAARTSEPPAVHKAEEARALQERGGGHAAAGVQTAARLLTAPPAAAAVADVTTAAAAVACVEEVAESVNLLSLASGILGDPDSCLQLLRAKPSAGKFEFRAKISELSEQVRQMKGALADNRQRQRELLQALGAVEGDVNCQLRNLAGELGILRVQLKERGELTKELQQAIRAVWQEDRQTLLSPGKHAADEEEHLERVRRLQEQQDQLALMQRCCAADASRADAAEALAAERGFVMQSLRKELEEARKSARVQERAASEWARRAKNQAEEAAKLLRQQMDEAAAHSLQLRETARLREEELVAKLRKTKARLRDFDGRTSVTSALGVDEFSIMSGTSPLSPSLEERPLRTSQGDWEIRTVPILGDDGAVYSSRPEGSTNDKEVPEAANTPVMQAPPDASATACAVEAEAPCAADRAASPQALG
eukprot:TRINITY_DN7372_c0_g1_i1.p1 TRINITY_DN7372_c0_g1~~TRINITY_DN7372_c0_g1_i1.p1  ORF type:complete len:541 (-),score=151.93 TRINITY_DN7372_c0_g1_i1:225-1847(-)